MDINYFNTLPNEMLFKIFSDLDSITLLYLSETSKRFRIIIEQIVNDKFNKLPLSKKIINDSTNIQFLNAQSVNRIDDNIQPNNRLLNRFQTEICIIYSKHSKIYLYFNEYSDDILTLISEINGLRNEMRNHSSFRTEYSGIIIGNIHIYHDNRNIIISTLCESDSSQYSYIDDFEFYYILDSLEKRLNQLIYDPEFNEDEKDHFINVKDVSLVFNEKINKYYLEI